LRLRWSEQVQSQKLKKGCSPPALFVQIPDKNQLEDGQGDRWMNTSCHPVKTSGRVLNPGLMHSIWAHLCLIVGG
jgi:hypothetical protein